MRDSFSFFRVQLATLDAFPGDRTKFVEETLQIYASLPSTCPEFQEQISVADTDDKKQYTAYVSLPL